VVYAQTLQAERPDRAAEAVQLADLFCQQARRRAEVLFGELFDNDDDSAYRLAQDVLAGSLAWDEEGVLDLSGDAPAVGVQA
ncbi:MAG TPA: acyl-CoA dehydrogenase, partial [Baekduia sp.]|nr:acyl-CoA dehydrogenase [Baekduia sp.]